MSFRAKLLVAFFAATLASLAVLAVGIRRQLTVRLVAQHEQRVQSLARAAIRDLARQNSDISARLATIARSLADDNRFRAAVRGAPDERAYLLDWAGTAMRLSGLSMLQLQDESGRILSSGHFRNEFDRLEPDLPRLLARTAGQVTIVSMRAPEGPFLALAREDSLNIGGRSLVLVGGLAVDRAMLDAFAQDSAMSLALVTPGGLVTSDSSALLQKGRVTTTEPLAYIGPRSGDSTGIAPAQLVVTHSNAELDALRRDLNRWVALALAAAAAAALALVAWMSAGLSRPLAALTRATSTVALEGPDLELATGRDDEIGTLARRFGAMTRRLRASAVKLRDAERRATVGDMARQVNHDIKNGLIPIRNVVQHLAEVEQRTPDRLPAVFAERRATLESSIGYLDNLARNYARLTPRVEHRPFDAATVARDAARSADADGAVVRTRIAEGLTPVLGDPVVLRRILDNLLRNAIESLGPGAGGSVTLDVRRGGAANPRTGAPGTSHAGICLIVTDTGRGMSPEELARAFDDFHTTKSGGTGLGLSVVRRLTADLQGELRVESAPGRGTTFTIDIPSAHPVASRR